MHCVNLSDGTYHISEPWSEYITDVHLQDSTTAWVAAHWGWSDFDNSQPGLYRLDITNCTIDEHWPMELAPVLYGSVMMSLKDVSSLWRIFVGDYLLSIGI